MLFMRGGENFKQSIKVTSFIPNYCMCKISDSGTIFSVMKYIIF